MIDALLASKHQLRDRIEAGLDSLSHMHRRELCGDYQRWEYVRRVAAGVLRIAFMPELARMRATEETLDRVRRAVRRHPEAGSMPVRELLAALYGDEQP